MNHYKIKQFDVVNDIWLLQKRFLFFFWRTIGVGSQKKLIATIKKLETKNE